jgi:uncharacterized protein YeaO (DUF488 family)
MTFDIKVKHIHDPADASDGQRMLVDRLWPRGISKKDAKLALWLKDIAPSTELRKWFGHEPERWEEFRRRYVQELNAMNDPFQGGETETKLRRAGRSRGAASAW